MDIIRRRSIVLILFLVFLFSTQNYFILSLGTMNIICKPSERTALLSFKQHLNDSFNSLSSWSGENCCGWAGVHCHNTTHHVIHLHLHKLRLGGELNPSLQELKQLRHLDLSVNRFDGINIPSFLGSLQSLRYLNLSRAGFRGMIPYQLGNLSNLRYFDLGNSLTSFYVDDLIFGSSNELTFVGNFQWISHLSSLKHLDLSEVYLKNACDWFHAVSMLPSLLVLRLKGCSLSSGALPTSLSHVNFTSLEVLVLSWNKELNSTLPEWLYSLTNLQQLDLSLSYFQGTISPFIGNLTKLTLLDLSSNQLSGRLPDELGRLSLLEMLDLSDNKLNGSLPESLGNLSKLGTLDITENAFKGIVSEVHFANLTNLQSLSMNSPSLVLKVSPEWVPPFSLVSAKLRTCQLGPGFPMWLRTQKNLMELDLSKTGISGTIPTWFWNMPSQKSDISAFDLSHNELYGELPKVIKASSFSLKSNQFSGQLPRVTSNVEELDLSNNSFSGPISTLLCNPLTSEYNSLSILDLSNNLLSGNLSDCWVNWSSLQYLRLGRNKITGKIPSSMGSLTNLEQMHLSNNNLSGELPSSLRNCTSLTGIDLGENGFTGRLPIWLGESFSGLVSLRLRYNKFYGEIPLELCHLASIRVLDIAHNDLQGSIPRCFKKFSAIATKRNLSYWGFLVTTSGDYLETTTLVTKGREFEYDSILLELVTSLDLSNNSLSGEIPEELTNLIGLISLNLSENRFTGKIPEKIGNMDSLESLDISKNRISGVIPQSISELNFLSYLNLSYNNLSGKIPLSTQLQRLTEFSFIGNQELCGAPLNKCNGEEPPTQKPGDSGDGDRADEDEDWFEMKWFYVSMGVGFVFGFWVFCGVLVLKKSWRFAYFQFLDDMKDKLYLLF